MSLREYQQEVKRTCATTDVKETMKMALVGLSDELGEVAGPVKKFLWHGHGLDLVKVGDEMGDVLWYLATLANALNIDLEYVMMKNVEKLRKRYPEGFSYEKSRNRIGEE